MANIDLQFKINHEIACEISSIPNNFISVEYLIKTIVMSK